MFSDPSTIMGRELDSSGSSQLSKRVEPTVWPYGACPRRDAASPWHARITSAPRSIPSDPEYHECRPDAVLTELWYAPTRGSWGAADPGSSTRRRMQGGSTTLSSRTRPRSGRRPPKRCPPKRCTRSVRRCTSFRWTSSAPVSWLCQKRTPLNNNNANDVINTIHSHTRIHSLTIAYNNGHNLYDSLKIRHR